MDLDTVTDELYALAPSEFTAARNDKVKAARRFGDRNLATAVKALRRPSMSAWAVNLVAREHPAEVAQLVDLGAQLRKAQAARSGEDLRSLGRQRQAAVKDLTRTAAALTAKNGHPLTTAAQRETEATLEAVLADPQAAQEVRRGCLVEALRYSGLGLPDADATTNLEQSRPIQTKPPTPPGSAAKAEGRSRAHEVAAEAWAATAQRKAITAALAEASNAEAAAGTAHAELAEATRSAESVAARAALVADQAARLEQQLDDLHRDSQDLNRQADEAREVEHSARIRAEQMTSRAHEARRDAEALEAQPER